MGILPAAMLGYAMLQGLVLIRLIPWIVGKSFTPGYWGSAFGATAFAMLALRLADRDQPFAAAIAPWLFVGANVVLAILAVGTLRLLVRGRLIGHPRAPSPLPCAPRDDTCSPMPAESL